jgi:transposase InsO family protein
MLNSLYAKRYFTPSYPGSFGGITKFKRVLREKEALDTSQLKTWLTTQPTYTLYKARPKRIKRHPIISFAKNSVWEADLLELSKLDSEANNIRFIGVFIDVATKFVWAIPLPNKSAETIIPLCTKLFLENAPANLRTDRGSEFTNKEFRQLCRKIGINVYHSNDSVKSSVSERFIRSLREKVRRYQQFAGSRKFLHVLPQLVLSYNRTPHKSHGFTPEEALRLPDAVLFRKKYRVKNLRFDLPLNPKKQLLKPGDRVRIISFKSTPWMKSQHQTPYTRETFRVDRVRFRYPDFIYFLKDKYGDEVIGSFLPTELQKITE